MTDEALVELRNVSKYFAEPGGATHVLRDVNLSLTAGEKASLVGPSGSGKSTLLSIIAGLLSPTSGSVTINGRDLASMSDGGRARMRAATIGVALQSDNLVPFLTAAENVELAIRFGGTRSRRAARRRALRLLDRFGVAERAQHPPRQLSGGEAQRVALAVAMANDPALLLADEVVAQLDGDTAASVIDSVLGADFAVLLVTHDRDIAALTPRRYELVGHEVVPA